MASEHEEVKARRLMASVRVGVVDCGIPHGEVRRRLWQLAGDHAAAVDWRCGGAWELREARAELKAVVLWCLERETGECERRNSMRRTR